MQKLQVSTNWKYVQLDSGSLHNLRRSLTLAHLLGVGDKVSLISGSHSSFQ